MQEKARKQSSLAGVENRRAQRRTKEDRRTEIRWEPGKKLRRLGTGRRKTDGIWDRV